MLSCFCSCGGNCVCVFSFSECVFSLCVCVLLFAWNKHIHLWLAADHHGDENGTWIRSRILSKWSSIVVPPCGKLAVMRFISSVKQPYVFDSVNRRHTSHRRGQTSAQLEYQATLLPLWASQPVEYAISRCKNWQIFWRGDSIQGESSLYI